MRERSEKERPGTACGKGMARPRPTDMVRRTSCWQWLAPLLGLEGAGPDQPMKWRAGGLKGGIPGGDERGGRADGALGAAGRGAREGNDEQRA